jgi:hypothetical protein
MNNWSLYYGGLDYGRGVELGMNAARMKALG